MQSEISENIEQVLNSEQVLLKNEMIPPEDFMEIEVGEVTVKTEIMDDELFGTNTETWMTCGVKNGDGVLDMKVEKIKLESDVKTEQFEASEVIDESGCHRFANR
ncbi:unnamed protein product [Acanthoscelides obtectus]|uniref:Uncharacterized protein n=1 Tax=Acanthoscelides obtectus TaxID=200917 RepID=A0A9P0LJ24_ACAOB|nr:unnamed protein product [Acanthoscelides obtectus]CAK1664910.1 hypothetical protein AOBTE_LOCUS24546 [Acanthoscelides obtectus]